MAKKIDHRGHGGHRELLFSLWFSKAHFRKIIKSLDPVAANIFNQHIEHPDDKDHNTLAPPLHIN